MQHSHVQCAHLQKQTLALIVSQAFLLKESVGDFFFFFESPSRDDDEEERQHQGVKRIKLCNTLKYDASHQAA